MSGSRIRPSSPLAADLGDVKPFTAKQGQYLATNRSGHVTVTSQSTEAEGTRLSDRCIRPGSVAHARLEPMLKTSAPMTAALIKRIAALPPLRKLAANAQEDYADAWCGGQIEKSLRNVLNA
jgi:Glutathione S-transferase, C-terminal domain